jgi:site-specific DNA recombinase
MQQLQLLGVTRLSVWTDESTNPERHRAKIEAYAAAHGHQVIGFADDVDVSGKIPPAERPELGAWLKRHDEWDALVVAKPDRISRSLRDFLNLLHDLDAKGKTVISLDPELNFGTPVGRLVANVLMSFAQFEREMISDRVKDAYDHVRNGGGYAGGQVPFGYMAVRREGKGWEYQLDPEYAPIVRAMVDKILSGESMRQVAIWLKNSGIPTSRNVMRLRQGKPADESVWHSATVKELLMSPAIAGMQTTDGEPLRGPDGLIVQRCEGIIDRQTWELVKAAITGPAHRAARVDANPLLGVAFCGACSAPLYITSGTKKGKVYSYYRCSANMKRGTCDAKAIPVTELDETFEYRLLEQVGDVERMLRIPVPAEDHAEALALTEESIASLQADRYERNLFRGETGTAEYVKLMNGLEDRREKLTAMPSRPAGYHTEKTGQTYRDYWASLNAAERRQFMLNAGIKALCIRLERDDLAAMKVRPEMATRGVMILWKGPALDELRRLARRSRPHHRLQRVTTRPTLHRGELQQSDNGPQVTALPKRSWIFERGFRPGPALITE